jgi:lipopolysaccharide transport system ATP-binding protein
VSVAVRAVAVSKAYRLGAARPRHNTLGDEVAHAARRLVGRGGPRAAAEQVWALRDVSFEIGEGEVVGLVGLNGAGKSTLLKVLSRITDPTAGRTEVHGRLGSLLEVGTGFHWELTGRENVYLSGAILGMRRAEIDRKFDAIVAFSELERFLDTPVKHYSSGMYVRLAFAVAAHLEPDVLLIDEVLSVGDLAFQRKCLAHVERLRTRSGTVLVVSHNMFAIKSTCRRALYLAQGRLRYDGTPEEAIRLYEADSRLAPAPWAQHLIGSDPGAWPVRITGVHLLDEAGRPQTVFDHGQRLRVRIEYEAREAVADPNFNVSFQRSDGVSCCNHNTAMDGLAAASIHGAGAVELLTPPLKLVADTYVVHVMVWDARFERLYAAQVGSTVHVRHGVLTSHFGVFHEPAEWRWPPGETNGRVAAGREVRA